MGDAKVYLAGPVQFPEDGGHTWRDEIVDDHDQFEWLNPLSKYDGPASDVHIVEDIAEVEERHDLGDFLTSLRNNHRVVEDGEVQEYVTVDNLVTEDKAMVDAADAVLVGWSRVPSVGTPMEVLYAYEQDTPVVVWTRHHADSSPLLRDDLSPWMLYHADEIVESPSEAMAALEKEVDDAKEWPSVDEMTTKELREEYTSYDIASLDIEDSYWDRHLEVWRELESRDIVDFPDCPECGESRWRFEAGGPSSCASCGAYAGSAELETDVHEASRRLLTKEVEDAE